MTVLVAQNTKDKIILGADTGCFYGVSGSKFHLDNHKGRLKIMQVNDVVYAGTGLVSEIINFGLFCQTRKPERNDQLGIQRFFIDFSKWLKDQNIEFNGKVIEWLATNNSVDFVILSSSFDWVEIEKTINEVGEIYEPNNELVLEKLKQTIEKIISLGIGVLVVEPTPRSGKNIGNCLTKKYQFENNINCDFYYFEKKYQYEFLKKISIFSPVYWLHKDICLNGVCSAEKEGIFIFRDEGHLSKEGSSFLGKKNQWYDNFKNIALDGLIEINKKKHNY